MINGADAKSSLIRLVLASALLFLLTSCVTTPPPLLEYNLARAAIQAAQDSEASRFDAGNMHEAEEAYRKAKALLEEREHEAARLMFVRARVAAERAENTARAMKLKSGEVF